MPQGRILRVHFSRCFSFLPKPMVRMRPPRIRQELASTIMKNSVCLLPGDTNKRVHQDPADEIACGKSFADRAYCGFAIYLKIYIKL